MSTSKLAGAVVGSRPTVFDPNPMAVLGGSALWLTVAYAVGLWCFAAVIRQWLRLRHIRGPATTGWSNWWLISRTWKGSLFKDLGQVCKDYGSLVRIGPNHVVCGDPHEIRRIWGVRSQFDRAPWYKGFQLDPPRDCTLSMRDSDVHTVLRSKLVPGYSGKDIENLHDCIDTGIARFVELIEEKYLSTEAEYRPVDLARKVQYMTLDVISRIAFGDAFGFVDADKDLYGYIKTTEDTVPLMQIFALIPWLLSFLQSPICKAMMPSDTDATGLGPIMATAKRVVAERFDPGADDRSDMLGSFVRHGLTQKEAEAESLVQIIAGSDTTATALRTIMVHTITRPDVLGELQAEISRGIANGQVSSPITDAEARQMPMLQACIKEGFRMWPPITGIMPRISDQDGTVCGQHIPAGTNVAWSACAVLRSQAVFGSDADMFSPARWLQADAEQSQTMHNTLDLCFGQGRWGCLGRPIALVELNKMVVELFRRFDFAIVDAERPIHNLFAGVLIQSELPVRISRRH